MFKKISHHGIGIDIQKNVMRYCVKKNGKWVYGEFVNNGSFFKGDKLRNSEQFINVLKDIYRKARVKNSEVVISAPSSKLLIRQVPVQHLKSEKEVREYLFFELGESIPLPFEQPIFDLLVYDHGETKRQKDKKNRKEKKVKKIQVKKNQMFIDGNVSVIVTSEPFLEKIGDGIQKSGGQLIGVDCSALAYGRIFQKRINWSQNFMMVELNAGTATITIFEKNVPVYVQHENYNQVNWKYLEKEGKVKAEFANAVELEALEGFAITVQGIIDYFETEISPGHELSQVYLVGEHPLLSRQVEEIIQKRNELSVKALSSPLKDKQGTIPERFLLAAGLSMKEV
ncbi:hypothetical protein I6N95_17395 [Vagococcus sp. BWB3-3]|uniref:Pilus assembly protein PilM n=1 Tax=Vagococcus allomyrinae TaxID=2794353 RepID=A0A940PAW7_9ENTE|nr:hypothetical protein [Vagococcus allomyrinae]MBP1042796.1 hypothetical protein [Vagococcus allomyrinae]